MAKDEMAVDLGKSIYANTLISICTVGGLSPEAAALMLNSAVRFIGVSTSGNLNINSPDLAAQLKDLIDDLVSLPTDPGHVMNIEDWRFYDFNGNGPATWDNYWKSFEYEQGFGRNIVEELWYSEDAQKILRERYPGLTKEEYLAHPEIYCHFPPSSITNLHIVDMIARVPLHEDQSRESMKTMVRAMIEQLDYVEGAKLDDILAGDEQFTIYGATSQPSAAFAPLDWAADSKKFYLDTDSDIYGEELAHKFSGISATDEKNIEMAYQYCANLGKWAVVIANNPKLQTNEERIKAFIKEVGVSHYKVGDSVFELPDVPITGWRTGNNIPPEFPYLIGVTHFGNELTKPN